jgi:aryl-alcohol dehydrogenase-like predicted oxidoreductase
MRAIPGTTLAVSRLCLGGNVFGRTVDEAGTARVLDAFVAGGGNFVDTAGSYGAGESETLIGRWLSTRPRDSVVVATKIAPGNGVHLTKSTIRSAIETSLLRLGTDYVDLYFAHHDDRDTPLEETLEAFDALIREGKVRYMAASNYSAPRLAEALDISEKRSLASYVALQPSYNLVSREEYESSLAPLCAERDIACLPYFGLASGFLTGKYRSEADFDDRGRAQAAKRFFNDRSLRILDVLDQIAASHRTTGAAVALAWLAAQPTVVAPLASARTPEQLADWLPAMTLDLSNDELEHLSTVSQY